jgi:hypothetical protein
MELELKDYKETLRMMEAKLQQTQHTLNGAIEANGQLLLRIDQLKWDNERLREEVGRLSLDLKIKDGEYIHIQD